MYYLTFVKGIADGTEAREVLKFNDITSAYATFHSRIGSAMNDANCSFAFAVVINRIGQTLKTDHFERVVEVAEETTEEA